MSPKTGTKLSIFDTFKTKGEELTGEANRQRAIISNLARKTNPAERTRTALSQKIAKGHGIVWKNIYSGIFRDLDEILIPIGLVEEDGRLPLKRGPKALQEKGIPYYHLTHGGVLVALSIDEIPNKDGLLEEFFREADEKEREFEYVMTYLSKTSPRFAYLIFEIYVKAFCDKRIKELLPFNPIILRNLQDDTFSIMKEVVGAFSNMAKKDAERTLDFINKLS